MMNAKVTDLGDFNHTYFHSSPAVSSDIVLLLRYGLLPGAEYGRPLEISDDGYWIINDGYPGTAWQLPPDARAANAAVPRAAPARDSLSASLLSTHHNAW